MYFPEENEEIFSFNIFSSLYSDFQNILITKNKFQPSLLDNIFIKNEVVKQKVLNKVIIQLKKAKLSLILCKKCLQKKINKEPPCLLKPKSAFTTLLCLFKRIHFLMHLAIYVNTFWKIFFYNISLSSSSKNLLLKLSLKFAF